MTSAVDGLVRFADSASSRIGTLRAQIDSFAADVPTWLREIDKYLFLGPLGLSLGGGDEDEAGKTIPIPPAGTRQIGNRGAGGGRSRKGAGGADKEDEEDEKDLDRELAEEANIRIAALDAEKRAADINFNSQVDHLRALVQQGKLTADQGLAQEQQLTTAKWSADENYLQEKLNLYGDDAAGQQRVLDEELVQTAKYNAKMQQLGDQAAKAVESSWKETSKQIADAFATAATDMILRTKTVGQSIGELLRSLEKDALESTFKGLFNSLLTGSSGGGSGTGGGIGGGIGGSLGGGLLSLLGADASKGLLGAAGDAIGNPFTAGGGGLLSGLFSGGGSGDQNFSGGAGIGGDASSAAGCLLSGGLFGALFKGLGSLFMFSQGGIVPSAAGGWVVPSFASGGILSMLHENEMVLPSDLSTGISNAIQGGGFGGGHTFNISAVDANSVARLFMSNGSALVQALNGATRNGAALRTSS